MDKHSLGSQYSTIQYCIMNARREEEEEEEEEENGYSQIQFTRVL